MYQTTMLSKHPLNKIRNILGFSTSQLGELMGLATSTIEMIEKRKRPGDGCGRPLTEYRAWLISAATGTSFTWLMEGGKGQPVNFMGEPLTREWHSKWVAMNNGIHFQSENSATIHETDILELDKLIFKFRSTSDHFSQYLHRMLSRDLSQRVKDYDGKGSIELRADLAKELTRIIREANLNQPDILKLISLSSQTQAQIVPRSLNPGIKL